MHAADHLQPCHAQCTQSQATAGAELPQGELRPAEPQQNDVSVPLSALQIAHPPACLHVCQRVDSAMSMGI